MAELGVIGVDGARLADDDVFARDADAGRDDAVGVELVVRAVLQPQRVAPVGLLELFDNVDADALLAVGVRPEEETAEETAVDGALIHNHRVFLVVSGVASDGNDGVLAGRELSELEELHGPRRGQRLLGVIEDVGHRVHAARVVGEEETHGLLAHGRLVRVSGGLVVVGERDDARADAEQHAGVDLAMRVHVRRRVRPRLDSVVALARVVLHDESQLAVPELVEVLGGHADHDRLLLLGVEVLDGTRLQEALPAPVVGMVLAQLFVGLEPRNVLLVQDQLPDFSAAVAVWLLLHRIEGPHDTAGIRENLELAVANVSDERHLERNDVLPPQPLDQRDQVLRVLMDTDPSAVDKHLGRVRVPQGLVFLEDFHAPGDHELDDGVRRRTHADVAHQRQVLDQAASLAFGRLGRAHETPVGVVKLAGLGQLAVAPDGRVGAPQMRQRRGKSVAVQHLGHAGRGAHGLLLVAPVARRQRVLESVGESGVLDSQGKGEVLVGVDAAFHVRHEVLCHAPDDSAEQLGQQRARKIKSLLAEVITVVGIPAAEGALKQLVHHVAQEEGLSRLTALGLRNVRQHLLLEQVLGGPDTVHAVLASVAVAALADEVKGDLAVLDAESLLDTGPQGFKHLSVCPVVANVVENILVRDDAESTEDDGERDVLANVGQRDADGVC